MIWIWIEVWGLILLGSAQGVGQVFWKVPEVLETLGGVGSELLASGMSIFAWNYISKVM